MTLSDKSELDLEPQPTSNRRQYQRRSRLMVTIFFDLDGTLTNPKPGITRSIQYALERLNQPIPSEDELTWCIGPPLHASLK